MLCSRQTSRFCGVTEELTTRVQHGPTLSVTTVNVGSGRRSRLARRTSTLHVERPLHLGHQNFWALAKGSAHYDVQLVVQKAVSPPSSEGHDTRAHHPAPGTRHPAPQDVGKEASCVCLVPPIDHLWVGAQRREWDLNPRWASPRRFSRPVHSSALSSLREQP
ncbi:MAG: hypothetical protein JWM55_2152 [Acidimicrobiaceae bacterium]|nr:hypothetical protein [Acidimicrobiaceae bacterium]